LGTAKATVNAIRTRGVRVMGHRKRRRALPQLDWFVFGHDRAAWPVVYLYLEQLRCKYEQHGDREALLEALDVCCRGRWNPPVWAASGFVNAYEAWRSYEAPTLDSAFGVVRHYDSKQLERLREHEEVRAFVLAQIELLRRHPRSVNKTLFAQVGEMINRGATFVSEVFYAPASAALRKFLEKILIS
jgi:hypothetical protein